MAEWLMRSTVNTFFRGSIPFDTLNFKTLNFSYIKFYFNNLYKLKETDKISFLLRKIN